MPIVTTEYLRTLFDTSLHSSIRRDPMSLPASTVPWQYFRPGYHE